MKENGASVGLMGLVFVGCWLGIVVVCVSLCVYGCVHGFWGVDLSVGRWVGGVLFVYFSGLCAAV
jgi:hypothetical protein